MKKNIEDRVTSWIKENDRLVFLVFYFICFIVSYFIFYWRFPNNFHQPNFYAEDGYVFAKNLLEKGFFDSLFTTFNGYYIWGLYLLEKIGFIINSVIYGGELVLLPRAFALVSYGFLAFSVTLPILLFRKTLGYTYLLGLVLLGCFVPLVGSDYAVIGTIGNLKYLFLYISFLLMIYRQHLPEKSKRVYFVDLSILLCAYTNATVYFIIPFLFIRYFEPIKKRGMMGFKHLFGDRSFLSLMALALLLLPQVVVVAVKGVPGLAGYLDSSYDYSRTIEVFISRPYLYSILYPLNKYLNDTLVVSIFFSFLVILWRFGEKKNRKIYLFSLYTIFISIFIFVTNRTGITEHFFGYKSGGPDQFFYVQNLIFYFVLILFLKDLSFKIKNNDNKNIKVATLLFILLISANEAGSYGKNDFMEKNVGNIFASSKKTCKEQQGPTLDLMVYPAKEVPKMTVQRKDICTKTVENYQPETVSFGLEVYNNNYFPLTKDNNFYQTFVSSQNGLNGISIYLSTFKKSMLNKYKLRVFDGNCHEEIRSSDLPTWGISDNQFYRIRFEPISRSQNTSYCFTLESRDQEIESPLAVQLSKPGIYKEGMAKVNNNERQEDVVFKLNYETYGEKND